MAVRFGRYGMTDDLGKTLAEAVMRHCGGFGRVTLADGLVAMTTDRPTGIIRSVYRTSLCAVLQGAKVSLLGASSYRYAAGQYLIASMDLPVTAQVVEASAEKPYAAFSLAIDPATIADLLIELAAFPDEREAPAMVVGDLDEDLLDPLMRLFALLDQPRDWPVLAPLVRREITWRLLSGPHGQVLRQIGMVDSRMARLARTIRWMREHYAETLRIADLAAMAHMSVASFHRHFKAVTTLSPIQFQKQVRLQEARRMLLAEGREIAAVGFAIGYESPSQFSRDYRRLFGSPPGRDGAAIREEVLSAAEI